MDQKVVNKALKNTQGMKRELLFSAIVALSTEHSSICFKLLDDPWLDEKDHSFDVLYYILLVALAEKKEEEKALEILQSKVSSHLMIPTQIVFSLFLAAKKIEEDKNELGIPLPDSPLAQEIKKKKDTLYGFLLWEHGSLLRKKEVEHHRKLRRSASLGHQRKKEE